MAVVARFFSLKSSKFNTAFLGTIPVYDASSSGLFSHLKSFLSSNDLDLDNCVGVGTDGASVMCGKHNSLFTKMKEVNPRLVLVKCVCHSLHLACNEAVDVLPTHMDYLVRETFNWFAHSPKRQQMYKAIYEAINSGEVPRKLVGISATRWLSIASALKIIVDQWLELKTHFDVARCQERCYSAKVLSEMYRDEQNLLLAKFVSPIVNEFDRINKIFQCENPDVVKLHGDLSSFVKSLMSRVIMPAFASPDCINWEEHVLHVRACSMGSVFLDALERSSLSESDKITLLEKCRKFLIACVTSVMKRLPSNMKLLSDLQLLAPSSVAKFPFDTFSKAFLPFIKMPSISDMESEYRLLQTDVNSFFDECAMAFWVNVRNAKNSSGARMFPLLSELAIALLTIPMSNAAVERVFSHVSLTKTDLRSRMSHETLENILHVKFAFLGRNECCKDFQPSEEFFGRFNTQVMYGPSTSGQ